MQEINTHHSISKGLCGVPISLEEGMSIVELELTQDMSADDSGLVHGGFIFGLADYAAMLAVNHPYVVLGSAESKFIRPASVGQKAVAKAVIESKSGKKHIVQTNVTVDGEIIFEAVMVCFVPEKHVLSKKS